jgi:hypothetical protein
MAGKFSLKMPDFHAAFRDLLHAVNLRHGTHSFMGACSGAVGLGTALQVRRSRDRTPMVSLEFFIDIILPAAL